MSRGGSGGINRRRDEQSVGFGGGNRGRGDGKMWDVGFVSRNKGMFW